MNKHLTDLYRSCKTKEALAAQDQYQSANVLLGSEVEQYTNLILNDVLALVEEHRLRFIKIWQEREHGAYLAPGAVWISDSIKSKYGIE